MVTGPRSLFLRKNMGKFKDALLKQPPSFAKKKAYDLHAQLGEGTFGKVLQATWTPSKDPTTPSTDVDPSTKDVALKVISKKKVKGNEALVWSGAYQTISPCGYHPVPHLDPRDGCSKGPKSS